MGFHQANGFSSKAEAQPLNKTFVLNSTAFDDDFSMLQSARSSDLGESCSETVNLDCQSQGNKVIFCKPLM